MQMGNTMNKTPAGSEWVKSVQSFSHVERSFSNPENNVLIKQNSLIQQEQTNEHKLLSIFIMIYGDVGGHHEKVGHCMWLGKAQVQQQNKPTHAKKSRLAQTKPKQFESGYFITLQRRHV